MFGLLCVQNNEQFSHLLLFFDELLKGQNLSNISIQRLELISFHVHLRSKGPHTHITNHYTTEEIIYEVFKLNLNLEGIKVCLVVLGCVDKLTFEWLTGCAGDSKRI
jgi:hypothetical protein